jgi:hypothetical protein
MEFAVSACGCPILEDEEWDLAEQEWDNTIFYTKAIPMFFHVPLGRDRREAKARAELVESGLSEASPGLTLLKDGLFRGKIMIALSGNAELTDKNLTSLAGRTVISKIATGGRREVSAAVSSLLSYVRTKAGTHPDAVYFWRTDCTRCAEPGGRRTVVLAAL